MPRPQDGNFGQANVSVSSFRRLSGVECLPVRHSQGRTHRFDPHARHRGQEIQHSGELYCSDGWDCDDCDRMVRYIFVTHCWLPLIHNFRTQEMMDTLKVPTRLRACLV